MSRFDDLAAGLAGAARRVRGVVFLGWPLMLLDVGIGQDPALGRDQELLGSGHPSPR
jgi:hypothetical protein